MVGDRDEDAEQTTAVVLGPGVDAHGAPDGGGPARFVDVAVQREQRLVLLDNLPDGMAADRNDVRRALFVDEREVALAHFAGAVEPGVIRRDVDVEDSRRRILELLGQRLELRIELFLAGLALGVPRCHV